MSLPELPEPSGLAPDADTSSAKTTAQRRRRRVIFGAIAVVLVAAIAAATPAVLRWRRGTVVLMQDVKPVFAAGLSEYRFPQGHFAAGFLRKPSQQSQTVTSDGVTYSLFIVGDSDAQTVVQSAELSKSMPGAQLNRYAKSVFNGLTKTRQLRLDHTKHVVFRGSHAVEGQFSLVIGQPITVLVVQAAPRRIYEFIAPSGDSYGNLLASFSELS